MGVGDVAQSAILDELERTDQSVGVDRVYDWGRVINDRTDD